MVCVIWLFPVHRQIPKISYELCFGETLSNCHWNILLILLKCQQTVPGVCIAGETLSDNSLFTWECHLLLPSLLKSHLFWRTNSNVTGFEAIHNSPHYLARHAGLPSDHFFCISLTTFDIFFLECNPKAETAS